MRGKSRNFNARKNIEQMRLIKIPINIHEFYELITRCRKPRFYVHDSIYNFNQLLPLPLAFALFFRLLENINKDIEEEYDNNFVRR